MRKLVVTAIGVASLGLGACSGSEQSNTVSSNEVLLNEEVPADENFSAVDPAGLDNGGASEALAADNGTEASNASGNSF